MTEKEKLSCSGRRLELDVLRLIAMLAVVLTHASAGFIINYSKGTNEFFFGNVLDAISRIGVPLFLMISGALLLDERRQITVKDVFSKYIKNIVFLLLVWNCFYACIYCIIGPFLRNEPIELWQVLNVVVGGYYHTWYLYILIGMYLITPFLRLICNEKNQNLVLLFILLSLAFQFVPAMIEGASLFYPPLKNVSVFLDKFELKFCCGFTAYYLTGWYIFNLKVKNTRKQYALVMTYVFFLLAMICFVQATGNCELGYANLSLPVYMCAVSIFTLVSKKRIELTGRKRRALIGLSNMSFGVYVLHPFFRTVLTRIMPYSGRLSVFWFLCSYLILIIVSFAAAFVLSRIPFIKKAVRM